MGSRPKPPALPEAPAPSDETVPFFRELARQATDRAIRRSSGRAAAFGEPGVLGDLDVPNAPPERTQAGQKRLSKSVGRAMSEQGGRDLPSQQLPGERRRQIHQQRSDKAKTGQ